MESYPVCFRKLESDQRCPELSRLNVAWSMRPSLGKFLNMTNGSSAQCDGSR
jgi:hypothetical protein